jgi:hypothetical protein
MLLSGIILLTHYLTKAYNKQNYINYKSYDYQEPTIDDVYNMKPSNIYKVMFSEPSIWQGYESIPIKK